MPLSNGFEVVLKEDQQICLSYHVHGPEDNQRYAFFRLQDPAALPPPDPPLSAAKFTSYIHELDLNPSIWMSTYHGVGVLLGSSDIWLGVIKYSRDMPIFKLTWY